MLNGIPIHDYADALKGMGIGLLLAAAITFAWSAYNHRKGKADQQG